MASLSLLPSQRARGVTAVLGPTNTGKTHLAIERMLAHPSGIIGLPLRLLAREVYGRIVDKIGAPAVALINNGGTVVLNTANTFGGGTTLNGGVVLQIGDNGALGTGALNFNGGTIQPDGSGLALLTASRTLSNAITFANGAGASYAADAFFGGATDLVLSGAVNLGSTGNRVLNVSSTTRVVTLSGVISGAAGLTVSGAGYLRLTNANNSYTGSTLLSAGELLPTTAGALGAGSLILNGGALGYWDNSGSLSNAITLLAATNTLDVGQAQSLTLSGTISGSAVWPSGLPKMPSGDGKIIRSAIRNRITPPPMRSETSVNCSAARKGRPTNMKASSNAKAIRHSRTMTRPRRSGATCRKVETNKGTLPNGSVTSNSRMKDWKKLCVIDFPLRRSVPPFRLACHETPVAMGCDCGADVP